jgi:serine/threonine protein kinase
MALEPGTRLGPYEILAQLGAGGMGEVYKGRDTRLDRLVALKVLSPHLAANREARERFEREATTVAKLKHAHICLLYDIGKDQGRDYLVFEYLEGETLSQRLAKSPLPLDHALQYSIEIADALDKAHHAGVTHRDIKPGNIMIVPSSETASKTETKLLDFGLAKLKQAALPADIANLPRYEWPTGAGAPTEEGRILGTVQYMAPEQVEGKVNELDARTDIFSFGATVYEMATGKKAFQGQSQASIMAAILKEDPPAVSSLDPPGKLSSPALDRVVKKCLAKEPEERWQSAKDLHDELKWIAMSGGQAGMPAPQSARSKLRERIAWGFVAVFLVIALALAIQFLRPTSQDAVPVRLSVLTGPISNQAQLAISPDGRHVAFFAVNEGGRPQIWIRSLDSVTGRPLPGTEGSSSLIWSPDSRSLSFFSGRELKKADILGGPPQTVCPAPLVRGGTWNSEGTILFGSEAGPVSRVAASGGEPTPATSLDTSRGEVWHGHPKFLPDGRRFLYLAVSKEPANSGIYVGSLDSKETRRLVSGNFEATYAPPGYLLFPREDTLLAQPFDADRLELTGDPVQVASEIITNDDNGRAAFSVSNTGVLVYRAGEIRGVQTQLLWADRRGAKGEPLGPVDSHEDPELSRDGNRVAFSRVNSQSGGSDIWLLELSRGTLSRFTFAAPRTAFYPLWSPDGSRIVFRSSRETSGIGNLYQKHSSGARNEELLLQPNEGNINPTDWSSDDRLILYETRKPGGGLDLWALPLAGDKKPVPFLQSDFEEVQGRFSPDGRYVAYASNESGRYEVYIRSFPDPTGKWQVSTQGGAEPTWRRDGRELFYIAADKKMMAVPVRSGSTLELGTPQALFESPSYLAGTVLSAWRKQYDVTADGQRFLLNVLVSEPPPSPITVVLNWTAGLKR